jgi:hypothetical protein
MSSCEGHGECLNQCECYCYKEGTEEHDEKCVCGHREHNGYCPSDCCTTIECRNYKYCNNKLPEWVSFCYEGMCTDCDIRIWEHKYTKQVENCCICLNDEIMIIPRM